MHGGSFAWPDNARVALAHGVAWETSDDDYGSNTSQEWSDRRPVPWGALYPRDTRALLKRRFAEFGGLQRVMNFLESNDASASFWQLRMKMDTQK